MSLSRWGSEARWFDCTPGYVYVSALESDDSVDKFNEPIQEVPRFCELAMRALEQSNRLSDDELEVCQQALESRFNYVFEGDNNE